MGTDPPYDPGDRSWPLTTVGGDRAAARVRPGAMLEDALLSPGCDVAGAVRRSVLSPGVVVEPGAEVLDSVLLYDVVVRSGARVQRAVLDEGVEIGHSCVVGGEGELTLVGKGERVSADLPAGGRQPVVDD